jgi:hypothetical protein
LFGIANLFIFRKIANHKAKASTLSAKSIVFRGQLHCFCTAISMLLKRGRKGLDFQLQYHPFSTAIELFEKALYLFKRRIEKRI